MKCSFILSALLFFCVSAKAQIIRDQHLLAVVLREDSVGDDYSLYTVKTVNMSDTPICILYSIRELLGWAEAVKLKVWRVSDSTEEIFLGYSEKDTVDDHRLPDKGNNPFFLLSYQAIEFSIAVRNSKKKQFLNFDYVIMPDFCFRIIRQQYLKGNDWSKPYKRIKKRVELKAVLRRDR